uniref:PNPLA domain-containing protein n=1 Tax=Spumella elongata TaxID=89044 RepID=A0A7S3MCL6_9STRA|mmetsp:Transcript_47524/g.83071  ORF Transcript_47524/g.83071 Transcript_47524/m.83071 type:complete len:575 (+) Transcript_47524:18-1742(+)
MTKARSVVLALLCAMLCAFSALGDLNVRAWKSQTDIPTTTDFPEVGLLSAKPNTAIAFSGGGSRAFSSAMGYLAALRDLDLLKNVRYIGGISGGAWATMVYTYQQKGTTDDVFLGEIIQPKHIRYEKLKDMDPACARNLVAQDVVKIGLKAYKDKTVTTVADAWAYGVSKVFLEPIGVNPNTRFSWNADSASDIKSRNPELASETILLPADINRPYPIIGTTFVGPKDGAPYMPKTQNYSLIEISPLYVGSAKSLDVNFKSIEKPFKKPQTVRVGGFVEPFGVASAGGAAPATGLPTDANSGTLTVPAPKRILDLAQSLAATSYAPGTLLESLGIPKLAEGLSMHFDYWSPTSATPSLDTVMLGDGGSYENIPLISFLQRRVPKIVLFFMSTIPLQPFQDWNVTSDPQAYEHITDDLAAFFGAIDYKLKRFEDRTYEYEKDQVFALDDFNRVALGLQTAQQAGNGIIASFNLTTVQNDWWGIPAGLEVEVTFSYLGRLSQWESQLSAEMQKLLVPADAESAADLSVDVSSGPFKGFPHFPSSAGNMEAEKANILADLAGWSVLQHKELFQRMLA